MHHCKSIAITAALLLCAAATPGAAAAPTMALPNCAGALEVRPARLTLACGDGNFVARSLQWTGWGENFAAATGFGEVNDCTPDCAGGKFHSYRVVLIASGYQRCPGGRTAYQTITYAWVGRSPFPADAPGAADPRVLFPCTPRK